mmetsp:Transcript_22260/g.39595  ORF Transcript_22260/g.39595 Transcript_22260/m.39595 type:complete len:384 (-) Transcript_22260:1330-2481(-)|eukprot:CAMPEP_0175083266 /NCGR_PEP_ID=MMETSP0052_2-20121109/27272_1 /TAXON_ID=51329 ORGANISM="Polytomella parva, Strain SAG 63-3" /NCGR_SAMPLE_ID=MMETSP0052_2 /ASSEMBLY_ACC=CAM_ASM_000194 /LENGTH=383 /DNA_ID=CAMNT_0016354667 /DNA_START=26 /DNA_END=1177 /DNA_ORIENTATION=-
MSDDSEAKAFKCARCGELAKLQCPNCLKLGLPKEQSSFCSQDCFKLGWAEHKKLHEVEKKEDEWQYCMRRGRSRVSEMPAFNYTGPLRPFPIGPIRKVPDHIRKPDYHSTGYPSKEVSSRQQKMIPVYDEKDIRGIREACRIGREILDAAAAAVRPGVTTDEIDRVVHEATIERGAYPATLNYYNYPKSVCTSVNEVICHGIPDKRELQDGDIVNVDVTAYCNGYYGDLNETFTVGNNVDDQGKQLIKATHDSLMAAVAAVKPGLRYRDVGDIISKFVHPHGFQVVKTYCGHGIGELFHCAPNVPHYGNNKAVGVMREGHIFTIEPMINVGTWRDVTWPDEWTSATADGKRSAQFEHQMLVTKDGCELLTARTADSPPLWWEK